MAKTGRIIITKTPAGEAPEWVRALWVGCSMPCVGKRDVTDKQGVLSGGKEKREYCYIVHQEAALKSLEEKSPRAAKWWRSKGFPEADKSFAFALECAKEVEPVPQERILVADDMEMGFMELPGR